MSDEWRVVQLSEHDAYRNMAIDESIMEHVKLGKAIPTMRFYRWNPSAVSIGRFQSMKDEVNLQKCKELDVTCVRRITGGGAVYHDYSGELTYSVIAAQSELPSGIKESYSLICGWIINGLATLGIDAKFAPINDITVGGKKISGNAQTRKGGVVLQHGTILYSMDVSKMFSVLKVSSEKISDKMIRSVEERVTSISTQKDISYEELYNAVLNGFTDGKQFKYSQPSPSELERAEVLTGTYSSDSWNFSR